MSVGTRTYFQATLTGQSTHTYPCAGCGCVFRTVVERTVVDTGNAEMVARDRAANRLAAKLRAAADVRPCPGCGLVPPAVIARRAQYRHASVWLGTGIAAAAVGWLAATGRVPFDTAVLTVPGLALVGVFLHVLIAAANPNRRRAENLKQAKADVAAGTTEILLPGQSNPGRGPRAWTARHTTGIALAAIGPLALLAPAYFSADLDRWTNPHLEPTIVPPGHTFTAPLPPPAFRSVNGWWSATATVKVLNAAETHAPRTLPAFTRPAWGGGFSLTGDGTPSVPTDLHVAATLPDDPALEGQTLRLRATLNLVYPAHVTKGSMDKSVATVTHEFPVTVGGRKEHEVYSTALLAGAAVCAFGTVVGGALLASGIRALKRQITPPELVQLGSRGPTG